MPPTWAAPARFVSSSSSLTTAPSLSLSTPGYPFLIRPQSTPGPVTRPGISCVPITGAHRHSHKAIPTSAAQAAIRR